MQFKTSFQNPDHKEVFTKLHECVDLRKTCQTLFSWLVARYEREESFKATLETDGEGVCVSTPAGAVRSRTLMAEDEDGVYARIVFVGRLNPEDGRSDVPVYALTVRNYDVVLAGDGPGREWKHSASQHGPWTQSDALALAYAVLDGQLKVASKLLQASPNAA